MPAEPVEGVEQLAQHFLDRHGRLLVGAAVGVHDYDRAAGLVEEVGTRPTQRRRETLYDAIADTVEVDENFLDTEEWADAHRRTAAAMFRQSMRIHLAALEDKTLDSGSEAPEIRLHHSQLQLSKDGLVRLNDKLRDLLSFLREEREKREGRFYSMMFHFCPVLDAQAPRDDDELDADEV